ncbi:hypothetical protein Tco_1530606 [Tanacetum coccineum]
MINKDNYVPCSSRLLRYAKSKSNEKLIYNSIMKEANIKQMEADDQAIQTILLGLPEDIYTAMNQEEVNELRAKRLAKTGNPLALMAHSQNSYNYPNVRNQNGLIVVLGIPHPNGNQNGTGNVVAARADGTGNGNSDNLLRLAVDCSYRMIASSNL